VRRNRAGVRSQPNGVRQSVGNAYPLTQEDASLRERNWHSGIGVGKGGKERHGRDDFNLFLAFIVLEDQPVSIFGRTGRNGDR